MDNAVDLPGYKYYVDERGERPAVAVTFVNIGAAPGEAVAGALIPFDPGLDARERNYERREVTSGIWAYVGTAAARERYERAHAAGTAVVAADYLGAVRAAFPAVAEPDVPVRELRRVDLD